MSSGCDIYVNSAGIPVYRFHCEIFEQLSYLCSRYVDGSASISSKSVVISEGTGSLLKAHCDKVWDNMLLTPTDFVHRHQDGTFYTETPTLMWQGLHQHLHLAISANSTLLHIMVANKISLSLNHVVRTITNYVEEMNTEEDEELREMELEFLCALINDNALHIEEVITIVESFENDTVRDNVNESFDSVTDQLIRCGQTCLDRLVTIILGDMEKQFSEIYSEELWLQAETSQVDIITATVSDYMSDFEEFLMPFWFNKFRSMILESVLLRYASCVLSHSGTDAAEDCVGDMLTFGRVNKDINILNGFLRKSMPNALNELRERVTEGKGELGEISEEAMLTMDLPDFENINESNEYLVLMELLNELNHYLTSAYNTAASHAMQRIAAFPSSAEAVEWFFLACMGMRDDLDEDELEECEMFVGPALQCAPEAAKYNAQNEMAEGPLGSLYDNLWSLADSTDADRESGFGVAGCLDENGELPRQSVSVRSILGGNTMTHQLKMMTNIPLQAMKDSLKVAVQSVMDDDEDADDNAHKPDLNVVASNRLAASDKSKTVTRRASLILLEAKSKVNVQALATFLEEEEEDDNEILGLEESEANERDEMKEKLESLEFTLENDMDKKSRASKMWQRRFFKIVTRVNENIDEMCVDDKDLVSFILLYYKKKGDSVLKSFNINRVNSIKLQEASREVVYWPEMQELHLETAMSQTKYADSNIISVPIKAHAQPQRMLNAIAGTAITENYVFTVCASPDPTGRDQEEHEMTLRVMKVDKMRRWIAAFIKCAGLSYDQAAGEFRK